MNRRHPATQEVVGCTELTIPAQEQGTDYGPDRSVTGP
jgi:hypothetical protein